MFRLIDSDICLYGSDGFCTYDYERFVFQVDVCLMVVSMLQERLLLYPAVWGR